MRRLLCFFGRHKPILGDLAYDFNWAVFYGVCDTCEVKLAITRSPYASMVSRWSIKNDLERAVSKRGTS